MAPLRDSGALPLSGAAAAGGPPAGAGDEGGAVGADGSACVATEPAVRAKPAAGSSWAGTEAAELTVGTVAPYAAAIRAVGVTDTNSPSSSSSCGAPSAPWRASAV